MKKLLVLGGTRISCEIVKKAQEKGIFVIVTDYNDFKDSPGKQIADKYFDISCTDVDAVVSLIKKEEIDGVLVGFADVLLPYYAEICKKANLTCYGTKELFELFIDKSKYKEKLREYEIPTVDDYKFDVNYLKVHDEIFPLLIKPADSSGSRGITVCSSFENVERAYNKAKSLSKTKNVLIEKYIDSEEVTAFWFFCDGEYYFCGLGNRHVKHGKNEFIPLPVGYTFPSIYTDIYIKKYVTKCKKMFKSLGIKNGMMFMQCKVENDEIIVYDIGYRLTGSLEYKLFDKICGYNPLDMMIDFAINSKTKDFKQKIDPYFNGKYPFNVSILASEGKISQITNIDSLLQDDKIIDIFISHIPNEIITSSMIGLLSQITVRVLGYVEKKEELIKTMKDIENKVKIISDFGECINYLGIDDSDILLVK